MLTDPPRLARLIADQSVKNQTVNNIVDNIIKLKVKSFCFDQPKIKKL